MDGDTTAGAEAEQKQLVSLLPGDGIYINNRILSRNSSVGQSSRLFYRKTEGVPFTWEMQPGTPKNRPEEEAIPPLSPPPQVQSLGLPKPCVDHHHHLGDDKSDHHHMITKVWLWKKIKIIYKDKKNIVQADHQRSDVGAACTNKNIDDDDDDDNLQHKHHQSDGSLFNNSSTCDSSSSSSGVNEGSFCCSSWNISTILDEGDRKVYYCRIHKTAFAVENDGSLAGKILPRVSSVGQQSFRSYYRSSDQGVPFKWEMQPGTPKNLPENDLIPPPSPPPAVQGLGLTLPKLESIEEPEKTKASKMLRMWLWITNKKLQQGTGKAAEISCFTLDNPTEPRRFDDEKSGEDDSVYGSSSSSSSGDVCITKPNGVMKLSKFRRDHIGGYFCFNPLHI